MLRPESLSFTRLARISGHYGPASSRDLISRNFGLNSQSRLYWPNAACQWHIQKATALPSCRRSVVQASLTSFWALMTINQFIDWLGETLGTESNSPYRYDRVLASSPKHVVTNKQDIIGFLCDDPEAAMAQWLEREFTNRKVRGSNLTFASRLLSTLEKPGIIPAPVLPSSGTIVGHRKGATVERLFSIVPM
ncbi:hypothetical protein CSKR_105646 [Clonorchis sinensis]|uniref:Uncharacterized protein n=1 Tax=Clonorchis sinensis TaxID=79923 RepID=A0A3R7CQJ7_CLOSI|nr:hypothetical protein CSKR_105646 [Clonorchis sinensis]